MSKPAAIKVYCNYCNQTTNHVVLKSEERRIDDDENCVTFEDIWEIVKCLGCENISFRHVSRNSHDYNPETGEHFVSVLVYPHRKDKMFTIRPYYNAPKIVREVYQETIEAYNHGLNLLCAAGLRAVIEAICSDKGITHGQVTKENTNGTTTTRKSYQLDGKINGLHENGIITVKQRDILHEHRYLGNDAIHSLDKPAKRVIGIAIEVIEHTLDLLYEIDEKGDELTYRRGLRTKGKKKP